MHFLQWRWVYHQIAEGFVKFAPKAQIDNQNWWSFWMKVPKITYFCVGCDLWYPIEVCKLPYFGSWAEFEDNSGHFLIASCENTAYTGTGSAPAGFRFLCMMEKIITKAIRINYWLAMRKYLCQFNGTKCFMSWASINDRNSWSLLLSNLLT